MNSNAREVTTSTAVFELLAANPAHADYFCATLTDKGALEKHVNERRCSLPWLEVKATSTMQRSHVDSLLYALFLVVKLQSSLS